MMGGRSGGRGECSGGRRHDADVSRARDERQDVRRRTTIREARDNSQDIAMPIASKRAR